MAEGRAQVELNVYKFDIDERHIRHIRWLITKEREYMETHRHPQSFHPQSCRKYAIQFLDKLVSDLLKKLRIKKFDAMIPYMAMTHYDRFTWRKKIQSIVELSDLNLDLFVLCCFSIAWKTYLGCIRFRVRHFVTPRFLYARKEWLKMELHICRQLNWSFETVTPFAMSECYIPFLSFPPSSPSPRRPIRQLLVKSQADVTFTHYVPYVVFPREYYKIEAEIFSTFPSLSKETVVQCREKISQLDNYPPHCIIPIDCDPMAGVPSSDIVTGKLKVSDDSDPLGKKPASEVVVTKKKNVEGENSRGFVVAEDEYSMTFELGWSNVIDAEPLSDPSLSAAVEYMENFQLGWSEIICAEPLFDLFHTHAD